MLSASSRTLAAGARRCRRWPVQHRISAETNLFASLGSSSLSNLLSSGANSTRTNHAAMHSNYVVSRTNYHATATFSTVPLDGTSFQVGTSPSDETAQPKNHSSQTQHFPRSAIQQSQHPQVQMYQQQIQQWINANPKIAPYKAEECLAKLWVEQQDVFNQWEEQQQFHISNPKNADEPTILFTTETVNLVLKAWCQSNNGQTGAIRAERLLRWMEDLHSADQEESLVKWESVLPRPDYESYAIVIEAWSKAAVYESNCPNNTNSSSRNNNQSGGKAKHTIPEATKVGFECAKRAEDLLMHMQVVHEEHMTKEEDSPGLNEPSYTNELQPDTHVFHSVLRAWSDIRGGTKASAIRAMRILDLMQELHHYQSLYAGTVAKVQPSIETYKLLLRAWAHAANTPEGPDRAEEILRHLLSMSKAGNMGVDIKPDEECFHIVMKAHAEAVRKRGVSATVVEGDEVVVCSSVERARKVSALLEWMELLALRPNSKIHPNTESYRIALSAWAWSRHVDAPKEAENVLFKMIRASENTHGVSGLGGDIDETLVHPETKDFNTVINCCAFARGAGTISDEWPINDDASDQQQLALEATYVIAEGALEALMSSPYAQPDSATFLGMIRACANLLPNTEERDARVVDIFRMAYNSPAPEQSAPKLSSRMRAPVDGGCVDANILRQLRHALPSTEDYIRVREEYEEFRRTNAS